jgi:hypothetical protein
MPTPNIPQVQTANTFDFWRIQTNNLINSANELRSTTYEKEAGLLYLSNTEIATALHVKSNVIIERNLTLAGKNVLSELINAGNTTSVSANGGSIKYNSRLNFVNSDTLTVSVTSGPAGNANIEFTVIGGGGGGTGPQGYQGFQGRQGYQGIGSAGQPGDPGAQGSQGTSGAQGSQGTSGAQGSQGLRGQQGEQGAQGHQGIQGSQGSGSPGLQGSQGFQGIQGSQGLAGAQGHQGRQGHQGVQGPPGDTSGVQGPQGEQGYQGNQGRQGHQGAPGAQGHQGNPGVQGNQGTQGSPGSISTNSDVQVNSLGVGTAASGLEGEIRATNDITSYYSSDRRLKENIRKIENALELIRQINGVRYEWKDDHIRERGGEDGIFVRKEDVGVIAQELQSILPEIVVERADGILAVRYEKIVALLIEAIKELDLKHDNLINYLRKI